MKEINLINSNDVAIVDDDDFELINTIKWYEHVGGYVYGSLKGKQIYMHRFINDTPTGFQTDHINHNRKDNRKENLRTCTSSQNQSNKELINNSTGYRGVTYDKRKKSKPYQARIKINKYHKHIGLFKTPEEAAMEYNVWAYIYHGEFAVLNKILKEVK
jgi:hypothetical protein